MKNAFPYFAIFLFLVSSISISYSQYYHWGYALGSSSLDYVFAIDTDPFGNVYAGVSSYGNNYIIAYDSTGERLWNSRLKGGGDLQILGLHVDDTGNLYATGTYTFNLIPNFPTDTDTIRGTSNRDIFILAYEVNGNYKWGKGLAGPGEDHGQDIAADAQGNIYVTGSFASSTDFDPDSPLGNLSSKGQDDMFTASYTSSGAFRWARNYGGFGFDWGRGVGVDENGYVYVGGTIMGTDDYDPVDSTVIVNGFDNNAFMICYDTTGQFQWTRTIGGTGNDFGRDMAVDKSGNIYLVGEYENTVDFDPGQDTVTRTSIGDTDIYLAKFNAQGAFNWVVAMRGDEYERGYAVDVDTSGNAYVVGNFRKQLAPNPGDYNFQLTDDDGPTVCLAKYDSLGQYQWAFSIDGFTTGEEVSTDLFGGVYMGGRFSQAIDADPSAGVAVITQSSGGSAFFLKYADKESSVQTSIEGQVNGRQLFQVYPNPAKDVLTLHQQNSDWSNSWTIEIVDMGGRSLLHSEAVIAPFYELDIREIPSGMYLLRIRGLEEESASFRFMKYK